MIGHQRLVGVILVGTMTITIITSTLVIITTTIIITTGVSTHRKINYAILSYDRIPIGYTV